MYQRLYLSILILFLNTTVIFSQSKQAEYLEAKRLMQLGRFKEASFSFLDLSDDTNFGNYASFYYGYCSYKDGDSREAILIWEKLLDDSKSWENKSEVLYWLAYVNLENKQYAKGIEYGQLLTAETYNSAQERSLINAFIRPLSGEQVKSLYSQFNDNRFIAALALQAETKKPYGDRDITLIKEIMKTDLMEEDLNIESLPTIKKSDYQVAVVLPFMFDKKKPDWILQNSLVMGLYQGMLLGKDYLDSMGIKLSLFPYDTRRDEKTTSALVNNLPEQTDLIIGPLYPGPIKILDEFARAHKINMINPVSTNSELILNNPYSFLFKPTTETTANQLAEYSDRTFTNRNAMIFYERNIKDSLMAMTYKSQVEDRGFNVVWCQEINNLNAKSILDTLTAQYIVYYTKKEADSILLLPGRFVKERRVRQDELDRLRAIEEGRAKKDTLFNLPVSIREDDNKEVTYYENHFYIKEDSIGHVFGASRSNALVNNLISAVETKGNNIGLLGYGDWIDFTMLSYNQLERIGVVMAHPDFVDPYKASFLKFSNLVKEKYGTDPSVYHMIGYELIVQMGVLLNQEGRYFQNGIRNSEFYEGNLFQGIQYGIFNDNQVVPLIKFENYRLKTVNQIDEN